MASDSITSSETNTPIDYSLRVSPRAKHAKLQLKPFGGLEVVVPPRFPKHAVPELVKRHSAWILRQLAKQQKRHAPASLPNQVALAIDASLTTVIYAAPGTGRRSAIDGEMVVTASGYQARIKHLRQWLRQHAWDKLAPMLERLSRDTGLDYRRLTVRSQKTRWGSCSGTGTISLNDQLLFVPPATVEYLMIHELCHTRQMNHSSKFWRLVEQHCAEYRDHEAVLNRAKNNVPDWFLRDLYNA